MHHLIFVRVVERTCNAHRDAGDHLDRQHRAGIEHLAQRRAFHVFHRDIGDIVGLTHLVNGGDIGVAQTDGRFGLAASARLESAVSWF
jgi:hypothetical protein